LKKPSLKIMFLAAEAEPYVKIGGLGDVAGTLPWVIRSLSQTSSSLDFDIDIRLVIPFHGAIQRQNFDFHPAGSFTVHHQDGEIPAEAVQSDLNGLPVYFISGPPISRDAPVYSEDTAVDGEKFTFFSLAALELARSMDWKPDIIHANDWHTAPAIIALKTRQDQFFEGTSALISLHNLPYMGENAGPALEAFGLAPTHETSLPWWAQTMPLPRGLYYADHIVAVSPTYAREILTPDFGAGLEDFLKSRTKKISGILNGIDIKTWDPTADHLIAAKFNKENLQVRQENKKALTKEFNLKYDPDLPLLAMVTRLDHQKGVDLIPVALKLIEKEDWQLIILGTGAAEMEDQIRYLEKAYPDRSRVAIRFDTVLSHRIYAGADAIIIPSRYEPCGLIQMIAMRYGCVPIARSTGGLRDTIHDHNAKTKTGFLYPRPNSKDLSAALRRAITAYAKNEIWQELQINGMSQDFSWESSARKYIELYFSLTK